MQRLFFLCALCALSMAYTVPDLPYPELPGEEPDGEEEVLPIATKGLVPSSESLTEDTEDQSE